jgi:uncharacterized protein YbjT (DUF2867 family)
MNNPNAALVIGATGLIGKELVRQLLADSSIDRVQALVRKPFTEPDPRLVTTVVDFDDDEQIQSAIIPGASMFCAIGTTLKKVKGDISLYEKIDIGIPSKVAKTAVAKGYTKCFLVSSVGADANTSNAYLRIKGKSEQAIQTAGFQTVGIFRPSVLLGDRNESRFFESVAKVLMQALSVVMVGRLKRYRAVHASKVAAAMINASKQQTATLMVYENESLAM